MNHVAVRKSAKSARTPIAQPLDPDRCFVVFTSQPNWTGLTTCVSLESLLRQVRRRMSDRTVKELQWDINQRKLTIEFEPKGDEVDDH